MWILKSANLCRYNEEKEKEEGEEEEDEDETVTILMPNFEFLMLTNGDAHHATTDTVNSVRCVSQLCWDH
jgi:hypothetical protein